MDIFQFIFYFAPQFSQKASPGLSVIIHDKCDNHFSNGFTESVWSISTIHVLSVNTFKKRQSIVKKFEISLSCKQGFSGIAICLFHFQLYIIMQILSERFRNWRKNLFWAFVRNVNDSKFLAYLWRRVWRLMHSQQSIASVLSNSSCQLSFKETIQNGSHSIKS